MHPNLFRGPKGLVLLASILSFFTITPGLPAQAPPPGVLVGPNLNASIHHAAAATEIQAKAVADTARAWARRADSTFYRADNFQSDLGLIQVQFSGLRARFNWMGYLVLQTGRPYGANVTAELDAGLVLILEPLVFLENQYAAGVLDRAAIVRACRLVDEAMREWEYTLRRNAPRLNF